MTCEAELCTNWTGDGCACAVLDMQPTVMHGDHIFKPGIDVDMEAEGRSPDPRWCNVCGEPR